MFSRSWSASVSPVLFWNPGTIPDGIPVSSTASRSARACPTTPAPPGSGTRPCRARAAATGSSGLADELRVRRVAGRLLGVPRVLEGHRDHGLVDQRVAQARDLDVGARLAWSCRRRCGSPTCGGWPRSRRRSPTGARRRRSGSSRRRQRRLRDLERDRLDVHLAQSSRRPCVARELQRADLVRTAAGRRGRRSSRGRRRRGRAAGRRTPCARRPSGGSPRTASDVVVGRRARADVARRAGEVLAERPFATRPRSIARDRVELLADPVRAVEARDRADVVEERVRVGDLGPEPELVDDLGLAVSVVVDVDRCRGRRRRTRRSSGRRTGPRPAGSW